MGVYFGVCIAEPIQFHEKAEELALIIFQNTENVHFALSCSILFVFREEQDYFFWERPV